MSGSSNTKLLPRLKEASEFRKWKKVIKLHFERNGWLGIVEGREEPPEDSKDVEKYEKRQAGAFSDLVVCLEGEIRDFVLEFDTVAEAWSNLIETMELGVDAELTRVTEELEKLKLGSSVLETVTKVRGLY